MPPLKHPNTVHISNGKTVNHRIIETLNISDQKMPISIPESISLLLSGLTIELRVSSIISLTSDRLGAVTTSQESLFQ